MRRPTGEGWEKVPSVTTGGKPFFWYRRIDGKGEWWVWDRVERRWTFEDDDNTFAHGQRKDGARWRG